MKKSKLLPKTEPLSRRRLRQLVSHRTVQEKVKSAIQNCAEQVPATWLDGLLTGQNKVLHGNGGTWGCTEIEKLCRAIKTRILNLAIEVTAAPARTNKPLPRCHGNAP